MLGDWMKALLDTPDRPEVGQMADILGVDDSDLIVGKLWRFWAWVNRNSKDGTLNVKYSAIDRVVYCNGFARALVKVGWLEGREGLLLVPRFDRHNSNSAKARALEAEAKRLRRMGDGCPDSGLDGVPDESSAHCPTNVRQNILPDVRLEKRERREEVNNKETRERNSTVDSGAGACHDSLFLFCQKVLKAFPNYSVEVSPLTKWEREAAITAFNAFNSRLDDRLVALLEEYFKTRKKGAGNSCYPKPSKRQAVFERLHDWIEEAEKYAREWDRFKKPKKSAKTTEQSPEPKQETEEDSQPCTAEDFAKVAQELGINNKPNKTI